MTAPPRGRVLVWPVLDQAVWSVSNLGLNVVVARNTSAGDFGVFSAALIGVLFVVGVNAAMHVETFAVRSNRLDPDRAVVRSAAQSTLVVAAVGSLTFLLVAAGASGATQRMSLAFAVVLPVVLVQDLLRGFLLVGKRFRHALVNDGTWLVVQGVALAGLIWTDSLTPTTAVLAWGAGAAAGVALGMRQLAPVSLRLGVDWLRSAEGLWWRHGLEYVGTSGSVYIGLWIVGAVAGASDLAALRGAQVLYGPVNVLLAGIRIVGIREARQGLARGATTFWRYVTTLGGFVSAVAVAWGVVLMLVPSAVGHALGATSERTLDILFPFSIQRGFMAAAIAAVVALRALRASSVSLRMRIVSSALFLVATAAGAAAAGVRGAVVAGAVASALAMGLWIFALVDQERRMRAPSPPESHTDDAVSPILGDEVRDV